MVEEVPADLIAVGRVADAWGLRGGIKVVPFSPDADALLSVSEWWFTQHGATRSVDVIESRAHGGVITATLVGVTDRDVAEKLRGATVGVSRRRFPALDDDEYYWIDLIGLDVVNVDGDQLGVVTGLMESGAHQILEVGDGAEPAGRPILIPFVAAHVKLVEREARRIVVDWGRDY